MNIASKILSDITVYMKYSRYLDHEKRRETWSEICDRYEKMMVGKYPQLTNEIVSNMQYIRDKRVLPSMRALQFAGKAIEVSNNRIYNCCFLHIDSVESFSETMFLLLGGSGVGYSVQKHHVDKLPEVNRHWEKAPYQIEDSIEGWANTIKYLIGYYLGRNPYPEFDYSLIRNKGMRLVTAGGKAPGHEPLKKCVETIHKYLAGKPDRSKLTPLECHDLLCIISDAVISGGIRRSALISLFSMDDEEMLNCKTGEWYIKHGYRARANNSVVLHRGNTTEQEFKDIWSIVKSSGSGEPGIYWTNDKELGTNPCVEISLEPYQFCNLTTVNGSEVKTESDFIDFSRVAAFFGTLQAGFTDFKYLRPEWKKTTEKGALIGVSVTGIVDGNVTGLNTAAETVKLENQRVAMLIGINPADRTTCIKPEGTTSLVLGTASGIHARHNDFYLRRLRVNKLESIYKYLSINHPELLEDDNYDPQNTAIITIPQKAPEGSPIRTEPVWHMLDRIWDFSKYWVKEGHRRGANTNNVSATLTLKERYVDNGIRGNLSLNTSRVVDDWADTGKWMWENKYAYNGLSVLPYNDHVYEQAPFEDCSETKYMELLRSLKEIDLTKIVEEDDNTDLQGELACSGGSCELK